MGAEARPAPELPRHKPPQRQGRAARERSKVGLPPRLHSDQAGTRPWNIVQIGQSALERLFGVGSVGISSAGQGRIAIEVAGLPSPQRIKTIIDDRRAACARYPRRRRERGHRPAAAAFPSGASEHPADDDLQPPRLVVGERRLAGARPVGGMGRGRPRP